MRNSTPPTRGDPRTGTAYAESVAPLILVAHDAAEGGGHAALLPAPTVARLLLGGGLAWLPLLGVLLSAGLYLWAVQRLHRRGYAWSPWRTASWLLGVAVIAYAVLGGIAVLTGTGSVFTQQGLFFSGAAVVTFGGRTPSWPTWRLGTRVQPIFSSPPRSGRPAQPPGAGTAHRTSLTGQRPPAVSRRRGSGLPSADGGSAYGTVLGGVPVASPCPGRPAPAVPWESLSGYARVSGGQRQ